MKPERIIDSAAMKRTNIQLRPLILILVFLGFCCSAFAQQANPADATATSQAMQIPEVFFNPVLYLFLMISGILLATIYVLSNAVKSLSRTIAGPAAEAHEMASVVVQTKKGHATWTKISMALTRSIPLEQEKDVMLDHDYDGIRELDNQLPPWWKWLFYVTIVFSFVYIIYYHASGTDKAQLAEYRNAMHDAEVAHAERMKTAVGIINDANVSCLSDNVSLAEGGDIFIKNCVACHGDKAQGNVGPNLTDEFWIHGGGIHNLFRTITEGVPAKGMISWKNQLAPAQIQKVASFVLSLAGTNPAGAKAPQGDKWMPEPVQADSSRNTIDTLGKTSSASMTPVKTKQ